MSDAEGDGVAPDTATLAEVRRLLARVGEGPSVFAVIDGAHWPDAPVALRDKGLSGVPLFRGTAPDVEAAGPWLMPVGPGQAATLAELVGDRPALVVWVCGAGEAALRHHLRTLNIIRVALPDDAPDAAEGALASRVVSFRHWDPRVLSDVLPVLDEHQFARVLGPAAEVAFVDPARLGGLGVRRAARTADLPAAPGGMLTLSGERMAALGEALDERSRRRIGLYLTDVAPRETAALGADGTAALVARAEADGRSLGLRGDQALGRWAYLSAVGEGRIAASPDVRRVVTEPGADPNARVRMVTEALPAALRSREA